MRGWPKTPDAALIAFSEHMGLSLNEWQRNVIHGLYDGGSSSPYTIASAPFPPSKHVMAYSKQSNDQAICPGQQGYPAECGASSQLRLGAHAHTLGGYSDLGRRVPQGAIAPEEPYGLQDLLGHTY